MLLAIDFNNKFFNFKNFEVLQFFEKKIIIKLSSNKTYNKF